MKEAGELDNTLIIFIEGDNGGSAEGTLQGTANEIAVVGNGAKESFDYLYSIKDQLGGPLHYNHMPVPWSWAFNSPFQWTKRYASHFGGTRNGMVMSWPARIKDVGGMRDQFHYVTDIMPTILDAAGVKAPDVINGVKQQPLDGVSMAYTWDEAKAKGRRTKQIFEMFGNRAIYEDGWMASTTPLVFAWEPEPKGLTPESFNWELYNLNDDFSQGHDLAKENPEKLARAEGALVGGSRPQQRAAAELQSAGDGRGGVPEAEPDPRTLALRLPPGHGSHSRGNGADGEEYVLYDHREAQRAGTGGGRRDRHAGRPVRRLGFGDPRWQAGLGLQEHPAARRRRPHQRSEQADARRSRLSVDFAYDGKKGQFGKGGAYVLKVDGAEVAETTIGHTVPFIYSVDETLDVGEDRGTPILEDYADRMPFQYTGRIAEVDIDLAGGNAAAEVPDIDGK